MNEEDLYRILIAQISAGYIAKGRNDDVLILQEAECWAKVIMKEEYNKNVVERRYTGFEDANHHKIYEGDIFVYQENNWVTPVDFIENYEKDYSDKIELHPVFWDEDHGMWASDVYGDADRLGKYLFNKLFVVTNNIEHPELYNH